MKGKSFHEWDTVSDRRAEVNAAKVSDLSRMKMEGEGVGGIFCSGTR